MDLRLWRRDVLGGEMVAERLEQVFEINGAPLVLKRHNGGNLDCAAVDAVLDALWGGADHLAAPLSPVQWRDREETEGVQVGWIIHFTGLDSTTSLPYSKDT